MKLIEEYLGSYDFYQLTLAERGDFAKRFPSELRVNNKINSLQNILIPKEKIGDALDLLNKALKSEREEAQTMIFDDIEKLAQSKWTYNPDSMQASFKAGICFYANPKSMLFYELLKAYRPDVNQAKKCYKEFSLFLHKELLKEYKVYAEEDDPYLSICENIIEEEEEKFQSAFGENKLEIIPEKFYAKSNQNLLFSLNKKEPVHEDELSEEEVYISKPKK